MSVLVVGDKLLYEPEKVLVEDAFTTIDAVAEDVGIPLELAKDKLQDFVELGLYHPVERGVWQLTLMGSWLRKIHNN